MSQQGAEREEFQEFQAKILKLVDKWGVTEDKMVGEDHRKVIQSARNDLFNIIIPKDFLQPFPSRIEPGDENVNSRAKAYKQSGMKEVNPDNIISFLFSK